MNDSTAGFYRWLIKWIFIVWVVASILEWCRDHWQVVLGIAAVPVALVFSLAVLKSIGKGGKSWNDIARR